MSRHGNALTWAEQPLDHRGAADPGDRRLRGVHVPAPDDVLDPLADALAAPGRAAGGLDRMAACEQTVVLPPEVARRVDGLAVREELYARGSARLGFPVSAGAEALRLVEAGGLGVKMLHLPGWMGGSRGVTRSLPAPASS